MTDWSHVVGQFLTRVGAAAVALGMLLAAGEAVAATVDEVLGEASEAYSDGNYRLAAASLDALTGQTSEFLPEQKLAFWNLRVEVADASGMLVEAQKAAHTHLELVRNAAGSSGGTSHAERNALIRLARIKLALAGDGSARSMTKPATSLLREAVGLLRQALTRFGGDQERGALWEAEARLELARGLEPLQGTQDALPEYALASRVAVAATAQLDPSSDTSDEFARGIAVVLQAAPSGDEKASRRQAALALRVVEDRLKRPENSREQRGKLIVVRAACARQLNDPVAEKRVLEQILGESSRQADIEPSQRAGALVRLAELADRDEAATPANRPEPRASRLYAQAAALYGDALTAARQDQTSPNKKRRAASLATQTECLTRLQLIHTRLGQWSAAINATEQLLDLRGKSLLSARDPKYYRTLAALGSLHAKRARSASLPVTGDDDRDSTAVRSDGRLAADYLTPACQFWRQYQPTLTADLATALNHRAEALRYVGNLREADELLREAEAYCRSAFGARDLRLGEFFSNRAAVQAALGLFALAMENYDAAIEVGRSDDPADVRERRRLLAMVYLNKAQLHKSQRQLSDARAMCEAAHQAARAAGLDGVDLVPFQLARASLLIAEAERKHARSTASDAAADEPSNEQLRAEVRQNLDEVLQIIAPLLSDSEPLSALQRAAARHLDSLARYRMYELCETDPSLLQAAEAGWREIFEHAAATPEPEIDILKIRAASYLASIALRDLAQTRARAFAASRRENADQSFVQVLTRHAESRLQDADSWSRVAEKLAGAMVVYPAVRVQALFGRAQVLEAASRIHRAKAKANRNAETPDDAAISDHERAADAKTGEAISALRAALALVELPRAMTVGAETERADYLAQFAPTFDLLVDLLMERGRYVEAIQESERRRSRTFQDQLRAGGVDLYATANPQHVRRAQELQDTYYERLDDLRRSWANESRRARVLEELESLQRDLVAAETAVKSSSRAARQLLVRSVTSDLDTADSAGQRADWIGDQIGDDCIALVYYVGSERSYVVACGKKFGLQGRMLTVTQEQAQRRGLWMPATANGKRAASRPLRAGDVVKLVNDVREWAERPLRNDASQPIELQRSSEGLRLTVSSKVGPEQLYVATEILLPAELRERLAAARPSHVVVVPDGALHQLPFELLPTNAERSSYLLDELPPMCYAPSLHIYRALQSASRHDASPLTVLSVADPDYMAAANDGAAGLRPDLTSVGGEFRHYWGGRLTRLESAADESAEVMEAFTELGAKRSTVIPLTQEKATEDQLKAALRGQRIHMLHIAAHGLVTQRHNNLFGALALSTQAHPTASDDGFLALHEVFSLPLEDCRLAVLSACQTNCGPESPLEAGSTMARAFLCAGACRVVCSHWSVSDKATAPLVGGFMRNVARDLRAGAGVDYAKALHVAKKRLRSEPQTSDPYFWASFVLIGPPGGVSQGEAKDSLAAGGLNQYRQ